MREICIAQTSQFHSLYHEGDPKNNHIQIQCISLETIFKKNNLLHCDVLKVDCEGAEYEIFYQAPASIFRKISEIRMEYHHLDDDKQNISELKKYLTGNGYKLVKFRQDSIHSGIVWFRR